MRLILSLALLTLAACGSKTLETKKVSLTANDTMQFSSKEFTAKVGQTLEIEFKNVGKMPVEAMGHNLVILAIGADPMAFGVAATPAKDTGHIPPGMKDSVLAHTKVLGPGESETLTFTPTKSGQYPFLCSFPGHFAAMRGLIKVSP